MDDPVENGIGKGRVLNLRMPMVDGELGGKQTGRSAVAVIQEIQHLSGIIGREGISEPFIQDDQLKGRQVLAQFGEGTIDFGQLQLAQELSGFEIADGISLLAEMIRQDTGQKGFTDPGGADED
jgi:hypothetical protein